MNIICASFCIVLAGMVRFKGYKLNSSIENILVGIIYLADYDFGFTAFQIIKTIVSLLFFILECFLENLISVRIFRYLYSTHKNPCRTLVAINDDIYHCHNTGDKANLQERSFELSPFKHPNNTNEMMSSMFFAPCVGFAVKMQDILILQKLKACGKCQDWGAVVVYLISCQLLGVVGNYFVFVSHFTINSRFIVFKKLANKS